MLVYLPRFSCRIPEVTRCFRSALQGVLPVHAETATSSGGSSPKVRRPQSPWGPSGLVAHLAVESNVSHSSGFLYPYVQSTASSTFLIEVEHTLRVATVHSISSTLALFPGAYIDERRLPSNSHSDYYQTSSVTTRISCALQFPQPLVATAWIAALIGKLCD